MSDVAICLWGSYDRAAQGVAGVGRRLADASGGQLHAVILGAAAADLAATTRKVADRVVHVTNAELDDPHGELYLAALTAVCRDIGASTVLLGDDTYSQELAPRLAHRLGGSSMADGLELTADGDVLRVTRAAYAGRATAVYELKRRPAVVWLRARSFAAAEGERAAGELVEAQPELPSSAVRVVERRVEEQEGVPLEEAALIVSGGRGLGGPEPFEDLKKLAAVMGAQVGASRVACDEGWVPPTWQIGQTGKKIAPELYVAVGISGAAQHLLGIADAKRVAAVNTDPDAPIFKRASFGIVEDYAKVVPLLTEKLAALKD